MLRNLSRRTQLRNMQFRKTSRFPRKEATRFKNFYKKGLDFIGAHISTAKPVTCFIRNKENPLNTNRLKLIRNVLKVCWWRREVQAWKGNQEIKFKEITWSRGIEKILHGSICFESRMERSVQLIDNNWPHYMWALRIFDGFWENIHKSADYSNET